MQQIIRSFRAATMFEALELVRRELGNNAVVLGANEVETRRMLPWPSARQEIEVFAQPTTFNTRKGQDAGQSRNQDRVVRTLAEFTSNDRLPPPLMKPMRGLPADLNDDLPLAPTQINPSSKQTHEASPKDVRAKTWKANNEHAASVQANSNSVDPQIASLQAIVARLERQSRPNAAGDIPGELFQQYLTLINSGVEEDLAHDVITNFQRQTAGTHSDSPQAAEAALTALIEREMRCAPPIQVQPGRRQIVTLVGPTGVGKTTTLAKLAGHFHIREGLRVGLITVDNFRVGAIEQLRTYAEILNAPFQTAATAEELRNAIDAMDDVDLVLIDTAGRSPFDAAKIAELRELVRVTASDHVLLVLSLANGPTILPRIAESFSTASPTSLVLTKLDEVTGCGGLLQIARNISVPVSYLTTGQEVPDKIEPAHPSRLARLIVGRDKVQS